MLGDCQKKIWIKTDKELLETQKAKIQENENAYCHQVVTVPSFQQCDNWPNFLNRLEEFFQDNRIQADRQVPILLTSISESVYDILKKLCSDLPTKKSFRQLTTLLTKHYSEKSAWRSRIKFFSLKQGTADVKEWFEKVQDAASCCEFGLHHDEQVKNRFICGMKGGPVLDRLCEEEINSSCSELLYIASVKETEQIKLKRSPPTVKNKPLENTVSQCVLRRSPRNNLSSSKNYNEDNYRKPQSPLFRQLFLPSNQNTNYWNNQGRRDERRGTKRPHGGDDDDDQSAPTCICGIPAKKLVVRREGPNQGREFYVCSKEEGKCNMYTWADQVVVKIDCFCQLTAKKMTVRKEGVNQGRQFYACPKFHGDAGRCQFFVWADEAESGQHRGGGGGNKGGAGAGSSSGRNSGRASSGVGGGQGGRSGPSSAKKSKAPPKNPSTNFKATGGKTTTMRKCGICSQPGHNRKNCPQKDD